MKTINNNTVKQLINSLETMSEERYNNAREIGTENTLYRGIGEQSAILDVLAEKLGALWLFGADFADDREAIEDWCYLVINRANKLAVQAGDDFADGSTTAIMIVSFGKVCRWIYDTTNARKITNETAATEATEDPAQEDENKTFAQIQEEEKQAARTAFAQVTELSKSFDTVEQVAEYLQQAGDAITAGRGYGHCSSDAKIDANFITEQLTAASQYGCNPGKYAIFYRANGTHRVHSQKESDEVRKYWGRHIVGRLTIEAVEYGYTVTRKIIA